MALVFLIRLAKLNLLAKLDFYYLKTFQAQMASLWKQASPYMYGNDEVASECPAVGAEPEAEKNPLENSIKRQIEARTNALKEARRHLASAEQYSETAKIKVEAYEAFLEKKLSEK
jgi:hypothetical protein